LRFLGVTFLSKVEHAFVVTGRGLFIMPAVPQGNFRLSERCPIQLRTPDGQVLDTHVAAVEFLYGPEEVPQRRLTLMMPNDIAAQDVPNGTEIWLAASE
jgi:hypothetical protein